MLSTKLKPNLYSYAKINLGLKVLDLLPDGYHSIFTIMQEINCYDTIKISKTASNFFTIKCDGPISVPETNNLCVQAAKLIFKEYNLSGGVSISLTKYIPVGAGLGGGSSNAANVLLQLNNIFELNINSKRLEDLAFTLGCDIPFFIRGGIQISEGKGEKLSPITIDLTRYFIVLVDPGFSVSTKWAYSSFKNSLDGFLKNDLTSTFNSNKFHSFQKGIDWTLFENDFEKIINLTYPQVKKIRETLESKDSLFVSLSGSGSTMFGIFDDFLKADLAKQALKSYNSQIVKPIKRV
jgi:4-diphosphocytidyl-2-C-methyl-D-erythritol kinase|tara:strand:+ start:788 stop:1669 length:882 start_codon:yes stop_codon:yes gene_type:complete